MCMPNITLYVKETDLPLIEKAKKKLGDSLSAVFIDCVRERVDHARGNGEEHKITLLFWNDNEQPVIKKSFAGTWLVGHENRGIRAEQDESGVSWDAGAEYSIALSKQGKLVVYTQHCNDGFSPSMEIYDDFETMRDDEIDNRYPRYPENVIAETAAALGKPHEIEMDI